MGPVVAGERGAPLTKMELLPAYFDADLFLMAHVHKIAAVPLDYLTMSSSNTPRLYHKTKLLVIDGELPQRVKQGESDRDKPQGYYPEQKMMTPVALGGDADYRDAKAGRTEQRQG